MWCCIVAVGILVVTCNGQLRLNGGAGGYLVGYICFKSMIASGPTINFTACCLKNYCKFVNSLLYFIGLSLICEKLSVYLLHLVFCVSSFSLICSGPISGILQAQNYPMC